MNEGRYFKVEYDEEWYLFDSTTISKQLVEEQAEYGYGVFANSLSSEEIVNLLNELMTKCHSLEEENNELKHWKKRIIEYLTNWFNKTEYLSVLYKINEINNEIGLDSDE